MNAPDTPPVSGGLREQKRQDTRRRIAEASLKLFATQGYEATTIDAIAAEAGISRRTFFHYFKSKDDILLSLGSGLGERIVAGLAEQPEDLPPFAATRAALLQMVAPFSQQELITLDRVLRASEAVQTRKQASYIQDEAVLLAALRARWPDEPDLSLRLIATLAISAMRLSIDAWSTEGGKRTPTEVLVETLGTLEALHRPR